MSFLPLALDTDPELLVQQADDYMTDAYGPEWRANAGTFVRRFFGANALLASVNRDTAVLVGTEIFKYLGSLYSLQPQRAISATVRATITAVDRAGYRIEQGRAFSIAATGDTAYAFLVEETVTIPVDADSAQVTLVAAEPGVAANDLTGTARPIDALAWIASVALIDATGGGADAEPIEDYLTRLVELFQLQAPRPILPEEFATVMRTVPGVFRALAIDGYDPDDGSTDNTRMLGLWGIREDGTPIPEPTRLAAGLLLAARREATFVVNVIETPDYTTVDLDFRGVALPGWDPEAVETNAIEVLTSRLQSSSWGLVDRRGWRVVNVVRASQLEAAATRVQGMDYVELTISGGSPDLALAGVAPLTRPGAITGTVTAP